MKNPLIPIIIALLLVLPACSTSPTVPQPTNILHNQSAGSTDSPGRYTFGMWELVFDFENLTADAIPLRHSSGHFNVRKFMEQGPCFDCLTLMNFTPLPDHTFTIDVQFEHPFPGLDNLSGFDVRGVAIFNGTYNFPASGLVMSDMTLGDVELLNSDGYTTLFNPVDYPEGSGMTILTYTKGNLATPLSNPSILNGFKNFFPDAERRLFRAGESNVQNYHIARPDGTKLRVGYAVDASWTPPTVKPVEDPLTEFPIEANCIEAYAISAQIGEGMMPGCGSAPYTVDVWDWQGFDTVGFLTLESPDLLSTIITDNSPVDMGGFARFTGMIPNELELGEGVYRVLVGVTDKIEDTFLGPVTAYILTPATVEITPVDYENGWRKHGRTLDNHNHNTIETEIGTNLSEVWTHQFDAGIGSLFFSTPTIGAFGVYYTVSVPYAQKIWVLDPDTGLPVWDMGIKFTPDNAIYGSVPLVGNCEVWVGGSSVFSFDAEDGDLLWNFDGGITQYTHGGPAMDDSIVVIWGFDNTLFGVDAYSGDKLWDYSVFVDPAIPNTPVIEDGVVYAGDMYGNAFALNLADGSEIWQITFPTGGPLPMHEIHASPVMADGLIWFPCTNTNLYGVDPSDGSIVVTVSLNDRVPWAPPAYDGTYIYQPVTYHPTYWQHYDGPFGVMAIETDGDVAWEFNPVDDTEGFISPPAIANGTVYVASTEGIIYMLDPSDGTTPINVYILGASVDGGMSILDGRLYVCDADGMMYCLGNE